MKKNFYTSQFYLYELLAFPPGSLGIISLFTIIHHVQSWKAAERRKKGRT